MTFLLCNALSRTRCLILLLAVLLNLSAMSEANAVDFQIKGQWLVGFELNEGIGYPYLVNKIRDNSGKHAARTNDTFAASQQPGVRLHCQYDG